MGRHPNVPTYTLRGERDGNFRRYVVIFYISTHTLRGERDFKSISLSVKPQNISTHTLRGERDRIKSRW